MTSDGGKGTSTIAASTALFAVYAGLTASGYDRVGTRSPGPATELTQRVHGAAWPPVVGEYFAMARNRVGGVNPYWPRVYLLAVAALHVRDEAPWAFRDLADFRQQVAALDGHPAERGAEALAWLERLPVTVTELIASPAAGPLEAEYRAIVAALAPSFAKASDEAFAAVSGRLSIAASEWPGLTLLPNPLQATEQADFAPFGGRIAVIAGEADAGSIAHELLHHVFGPRLTAHGPLIAGYRDLLGPVLGAMRSYAYAWADDEASWRRVFEESLVRAATLWVMAGPGDSGLRRALEDAEEGFAYVPPLLEHFDHAWTGLQGLEAFIGGALERCRRSSSTR